MKKKLLLSLLLAGTLIQANDYKYEISPMLGYDIAEGNLDIKDDGYFTGGLEAQFNTLGSKLSPEFSVFHSRGVDYTTGGDTQITRGAFNGVYTFEPTNYIIPFTKLGAGIENISNEHAVNQTGMFVDAGAGVKVPFAQNWALKLEATYLAKIGSAHNKDADNNLMTLIGLTYSFGSQKQIVAPAPVDNDHDGVVDSQDKCLNTPANTKVDASGCAIPVDTDGDGVYDKLDKCPNTPAGSTVDANGCKIILDDDHDGVVNSVDKCPNTPAGSTVDANGCKIILDDDHDGVPNNMDKCPNTPKGAAVNADGCPETINLNINFKNNSYVVQQTSLPKIDEFAKFLKEYKNYSAEIAGYTDSRGSEVYNKKLSQKRAEAVKQLLIQKGVEASRLTSVGMGEANPVATNKTAEGRAQNRRIEANLTLN